MTSLLTDEAKGVGIDRDRKVVEVCTESGVRLSLPWIWLRDHCRSTASYNHRTFQRKQDLLAIPLHVEPTRARVENDTLLVQCKFPIASVEGMAGTPQLPEHKLRSHRGTPIKHISCVILVAI